MPDHHTIFNVGVNPSHLAITPNGKFAYVTNSNNYGITGSDNVTVLNLRTKIPRQTINDPSFNQPYRIAIDCKGKYAYVCNSGSPSVTGTEGTLSIINLKTNTVCGTIPGFDGPGGIVINKNIAYVTNYGAAAGVGSGNGKTISVVDLKRKSIIDTITTSLAPSALKLSPCAKYLYVTCYVDGNPNTGTLNIISTRSNTVKHIIDGLFGPFDLDLTRCGNYAYVTNFGSNNFAPYGTTVAVVDLIDKCIVKEIEVGIQPAAVVVGDNKVYVTLYNALYAGSDYSDLTFGAGTIVTICNNRRKIIAPAVNIGQGPSGLVKHCDTLYITQYPQNTVTELCRSQL